jgi:IS30 family transposase
MVWREIRRNHNPDGDYHVLMAHAREMASWRQIQIRLDTPVYFCNPHLPWQRGTNENTNRLLRFWFEKGCRKLLDKPPHNLLVDGAS